MSSKKEEKFLSAALTELFRRVGRKYSRNATSMPEWYCESTWTSVEQEDYRRWLTQLIMRDYRHRVARAKMEAGWFILNYGWKVNRQPIKQLPPPATSDKRKKRPQKARKPEKKP